MATLESRNHPDETLLLVLGESAMIREQSSANDPQQSAEYTTTITL